MRARRETGGEIWSETLFISLITILALGLRLFRLGDWSFWGDEAFSVAGGEDGFTYSFIRRSIATDAIRLITSYFGPTEWNARIFPALVGAVSVVFLYWMVRGVLGKPTALAASILLAVSPWHLYWSQNARFYTLLFLFYTVAMLAFFKGLERDRPGLMIAALVFLGLAARERLLGLFFVPVAGLYVLLLWAMPFEKPPGLNARNLAIFFGPLLVGGGVFIWPYIKNLSQWLVNFGPSNNSPIWILVGVVFYCGIPLVCLAFFGGTALMFERRREGLYFSLAAVVPVLLLMGVALFHYSANRYTFVALSAWVILAAMAIQRLRETVARPGRWIVLGVLAALVAGALADDGMYFLYQNGNREDWKGALQYIQTNRGPGERVVMDEREVGEIYLREQTRSFGQVDYNSLARRDTAVWFIEDLDTRNMYPHELDWVHENASLEAVFDVTVYGRQFPMRVYRYDPAGR